MKTVSLFIFAHQDDESGVFWEIEKLVNSGDEVFVVYLTSGDNLGNPSIIRDSESIAVLESIGIQREKIFFLGSEHKIPDGKLCLHLETAYNSLLRLLNRIPTPQRLYFLAWEGGHQDHDAVHLLGILMGNKLGIIDKCFQFPLYTGAGLPSILYKLFSPLKDNGSVLYSQIPWPQRLKFLKYTLSYPSQKITWLGLFPFFLFHYIFFGTQILQKVSLKRIEQPPHKGKMLYERRGYYTYHDFEQTKLSFLEIYKREHLNNKKQINV